MQTANALRTLIVFKDSTIKLLTCLLWLLLPAPGDEEGCGQGAGHPG
jgi:hypothetical protein